MTDTEITIIAYISGNDELNNAAQAVFAAQYEIEHSDCTGSFETELVARLYDGFVYRYADTIMVTPRSTVGLLSTASALALLTSSTMDATVSHPTMTATTLQLTD